MPQPYTGWWYDRFLEPNLRFLIERARSPDPGSGPPPLPATPVKPLYDGGMP